MQTQDARQSILRHLGTRAAAVFVRELPPSECSVLAFGDVDARLPERYNLPASQAAPAVDVTWLPQEMLRTPTAFATRGLLAHRLAASQLLFDRSGTASEVLLAVREALGLQKVRAARIAAFLDLGGSAIGDMGATADCAPLTAYRLHAGFVAALAALCEGLEIPCPDVDTRPFDCLHLIAPRYLGTWDVRLVAALHLDVDAPALFEPLLRLQACMADRFPEPWWPKAMRAGTRAEYRYVIDRYELEWRVQVAQHLLDQGQRLAAVFYLRAFAQALSCVPMVWQAAQEQRDVSFLCPGGPSARALQLLCPEALPWLTQVLAAGIDDADAIRAALPVVTGFRDYVVGLLQARNLVSGPLAPWVPRGPTGPTPLGLVSRS